jgi:hypothetical protein
MMVLDDENDLYSGTDIAYSEIKRNAFIEDCAIVPTLNYAEYKKLSL